MMKLEYVEHLRCIMSGLDGWKKRTYTGRVYKTYTVKYFINEARGTGVLVRFKKKEKSFTPENATSYCIGCMKYLEDKIKRKKGSY